MTRNRLAQEKPAPAVPTNDPVLDHPFPTAPPAFEPSVEELLRSPNARERAIGVALLEANGRADAVDLLAAALSDLDVDVLYSAAAALAAIGTEEALDCLLRASQDVSLATSRRVALVLALGSARFVWPPLLGALEQLARNEDPWLRLTAGESLILLRLRQRRNDTERAPLDPTG
jgi:HEAT repeat protein